MDDSADGIIPPDLLNILACPRCRAAVGLVKKPTGRQGLACSQCNVVYPVEDGIPVMLIHEAIPREMWDARV